MHAEDLYIPSARYYMMGYRCIQSCRVAAVVAIESQVCENKACLLIGREWSVYIYFFLGLILVNPPPPLRVLRCVPYAFALVSCFFL